jgi:hypothetical protein
VTALRLVPLFLAGVLLAAHFLRWGNLPLAVVCLAFPAIVFFRRNWARIAAWCYCGFSLMVWAAVANRFITERSLIGRPWGKLALILGAVAAFSVLAAFLLRGERMRKFFRVGEQA